MHEGGGIEGAKGELLLRPGGDGVGLQTVWLKSSFLIVVWIPDKEILNQTRKCLFWHLLIVRVVQS